MSISKYFLAIILLIVYTFIGYYSSNYEIMYLIGTVVLAFGIYFYLIFYTRDNNEVNVLLWFSILFRLVFLFSIPFLSTEYLRYLFNGKLMLYGQNPYLFTPEEVFQNLTPIGNDNFSDYYALLKTDNSFSFTFPVVHFFSLSAAFFAELNPLLGLVVLRIPIIVADFFLIKFIIKLLQKLNLSYHGMLIYALNPLVIIGLTGNISFIGVMLCFFVIGLYLIIHNKWVNSIFMFAIASAISFFSILLLPLIFKKIRLVKSVLFLILIFGITTACWLPFFHPFFVKTFILNFEGSVMSTSINYFGISNILEWYTGKTNVIMITIFIVALFSISISRARDWVSVIKGMMFSVTAFVLLFYDIKPQYFVILIFFSVFIQQYHYAILWSLIAIINYPLIEQFTNEYTWIMPIEFSVLMALFLSELFGKVKTLTE